MTAKKCGASYLQLMIDGTLSLALSLSEKHEMHLNNSLLSLLIRLDVSTFIYYAYKSRTSLGQCIMYTPIDLDRIYLKPRFDNLT